MSLCIEIEILSCLFREMCPVDVTVVEFACLSILVLLLDAWSGYGPLGSLSLSLLPLGPWPIMAMWWP